VEVQLKRKNITAIPFVDLRLLVEYTGAYMVCPFYSLKIVPVRKIGFILMPDMDIENKKSH